MKKICSILFFCCFLFQEAIATGISYKQVILNVLYSQNRVVQFFAKLKTTTYNIQEEKFTIENTYKQDILWVRNEFLSVEIFSEKEQLLYLSLNDSQKQTVKNFAQHLSFFELDVENLFTGFYAKTEAKLLKYYESLGVNYFYFSIVEEDGKFYYKLGKNFAYVLLNKENYRTEKLVRSIYYNGKKLILTVVFKDWHPQKDKVPQGIEYYLNGKLFKQDRIFFLQFKKLVPIRDEIKLKYIKYF